MTQTTLRAHAPAQAAPTMTAQPTSEARPAPAVSPAHRRYVIVTPCRDEAEHLPETIRTVAAQTLPPALWVIVDDGSKDATPEILRQAERDHPFIRVIRREDRGERKVGPGVIEAFYAGLNTVDLSRFEYLCKLDADLEVPPRYFQTLVEKLEADPTLGTFSGKVFLRSPDGAMSHERRGDENSVGPSKFYRVACFQDIGGFARVVGWDGIDGHVCRQRGWSAASSDGEHLRLVHRRQMGSSDHSVFRGRVRGGSGKYYIGNSLTYVLVTAVYRAADPPIVIGAALMVWGYLRAMLRREPRFGDAAYRASVRRFEWDTLLRGKREASRRAVQRARGAGEAG